MLRQLVSCAALLLSVPAFAGSIDYEFRFDLRSVDWSDDATNTTGYRDSSRFTVNTGRVDFKGKVSDQADYRLRWRFAQPYAASNARDNLGSWIDFAFIAHKVSDTFTVTGGKFFGESAGFEGQTPGPDNYIFSDGYLNQTSAVGTNLSAAALTYATGFKFSGKFDSNNIHFMLINPSVDAGTGNAFFQNKFYYGLAYFNPKVVDGLWGIKLSYHAGDVIAATEAAIPSGGKHTYLAFGNSLTFGDLNLQAEYFLNTYKTDTAGAAIDEKLSSIVLALKYSMGEMTPKFKYVMNDHSNTVGAGVASNVKLNSMSLALEYKPKTEDNFRYHIAYNMHDFKPNTTTAPLAGIAAGTAVSQKEIIIGMNMLGDFLK